MYFSLKKISKLSKYDEIATYTLEEKKSKFISYIFNVTDEVSAKECIAMIQSKYRDARHIVYIYSYLNKQNLPQIKFSDDGEPQGTGTKAIYELTTKESITNFCAVIVRYFGGILLGAGPLSRAYLNSFRGALKLCDKVKIYCYTTRKITIKYSRYDILLNKLSAFIADKIVIIEDVLYNENICLSIKIEVGHAETVNKIIDDNIF